MNNRQIVLKRINKELNDLDKQPRPGITCYPLDDNITQLEAFIEGPPESPYEQGLFKLSVQIPDRYPFEPPQIKFITRIYHPNIDDGGRICADILKTGEKGSWNPAINIGTALMSLRQLIATPNPDDPLEADIAQEFKLDYPTFQQKAREFTKKYATGDDAANEYNAESTATTDTLDELPEIEEDMIEHVEEKPKKFLSLSKKKVLTSSNSQSSTSQSSKEDKDDTKILLPKSDKIELHCSPSQIKSVEAVNSLMNIDTDDIKISNAEEKERAVSLSDEEDMSIRSEEEDMVMINKKSILKRKHRDKQVKKNPVFDTVGEEDNSMQIEEVEDMVIVEDIKSKKAVLKKKSKDKKVSKKSALDAVNEKDDIIQKEEEDVVMVEKTKIKKAALNKKNKDKEVNKKAVLDAEEERVKNIHIEENEDMLMVEGTKSEKTILKKKNTDKEAIKRPVLDAKDDTKSTAKKAIKRKAKVLEEEDKMEEKADLNKCSNTKYPLNKPKPISNESNSKEERNGDSSNNSSSMDLELPKTETTYSRTIDLMEDVNKEEDFLMDEDITSLKVNDSDIASNAIDIIKSSMMTYNDNNVGNRDIIELSDDDDNGNDAVAQSPKYHSFSLSKKSHKPKISLSRKKRSP